MKTSLRIPFLAIAAAMCCTGALTGCGDEGSIGSSLLGDQVEILIDSAFTVTGHSEEMAKVQPKTLTQLVGNISIPEFGRISSTAAAQFLPSVALDTAYTVANLDSVMLNLRYNRGAFIGDSVVPMGISVYPLEEILQGDLYTDSPLPDYSSQSLGSTVYTPSTLLNDSLQKLTTRTVTIKLPLEFGKRLLEAYDSDPNNYSSGQAFTRNVFKGFYIDSDFGSGRLMQFARTTITVAMSKTKQVNDTTTSVTRDLLEYYAVSPELVNNNYINVELAQSLKDRAAASPMMVAPAGYNAVLRFPAPEVIAAYRNHGGLNSVLNSVTLSVPADSLKANGLVALPTYALMVLKKDLEDFFSNNKLPDNLTSFYATYSASTGCYEFNSMRPYIMDLMEREEEIKEEDYTFCLVPVTVNFELDVTSYYSQSYIVSEVIPYIDGPAVAILDFDKAKVKLTYSRQVAI